jgi:dTDP-3-amino-2,3,6-trideoxy-4-keto-D-glucose/dTDP-3-amino-3,4,6-trideoxy-alpha-D-glucose/dTDP-2,6-dideoxy-D-kanosamine transaminase
VQSIPFNDLKALHRAGQQALQAALVEVLGSGWYVLGEAGRRFEQAFADYCGSGFCVGVASGSDALELALRALEVGPGDRVVTVANAGGYASLAILHCGAAPLFVDIDPATLLLDPAALDAALATRPKALILTHLYGRLAAVEAIAERCREHGVALIEDCAQAHGAEHGGRRAGSFGALGCFSFYPTKNLGALGDAGAVIGNDPALATRLRALRQYGWGDKYRIELAGGRNSRLDELQAAFLLARLPRLATDNARRQAIARRYDTAIRNPLIELLPRGADDDVAHLYVLRSARRDALREHLAAAGIGSGVHYPLPDHLQPALPVAPDQAPLPHTERAAREILSLPCHPALDDDQVARVIDACCRFR